MNNMNKMAIILRCLMEFSVLLAIYRLNEKPSNIPNQVKFF